MRRSISSVTVIGAVIVVLILLALGVALIAGDSGPDDYPEGSPERALQRYLFALRDGDLEEARSLLTERALDSMRGGDFDQYFLNSSTYYNEDRQIRITETEIEGDRATLTLWIAFSGDRSLFDFERDGYETTVRLVREDGQWKIDSSPMIF